MYNNTLNKDALKPGDVVGIKQSTQIGWGYFRYAKTIPMTIERITPARTKFIMTNGCEFTKKEPFYPITSESNNETYIAECAEKISRHHWELEQLRKDGKLFRQSDEVIVKVSELLEQVCKEIKR